MDPLLLFASEEPVAGTSVSKPIAARPLMTVAVRQPNAPRSRPSSSRAGRLLLATAVSLVAGILIGFASGYSSAQRVGTPPAATPTNMPRTDAAPPHLSTPPPADPALLGAPVEPAVEPVGSPRQPSQSVSAPTADPDSDRAGQQPSGERRVAEVVSPATGFGSVEVLSRPAGAEVALDGEVVGQTPLTIPNVRAGTHIVGMELPGLSRWATSVHVTAGVATRVGASLTP